MYNIYVCINKIYIIYMTYEIYDIYLYMTYMGLMIQVWLIYQIYIYIYTYLFLLTYEYIYDVIYNKYMKFTIGSVIVVCYRIIWFFTIIRDIPRLLNFILFNICISNFKTENKYHVGTFLRIYWKYDIPKILSCMIRYYQL